MKKWTILFTVVGALALAWGQETKPANDGAAASASLTENSRLFELRTYHTHPGKLEALHARFREHTNALFVKHGMTLIGYWVPKDRPDTLVYMLAYPSEEARAEAWKAFGDDPEWTEAFAASRQDGPLVEKVDSEFLRATDYSPIQ